MPWNPDDEYEEEDWEVEDSDDWEGDWDDDFNEDQDDWEEDDRDYDDDSEDDDEEDNFDWDEWEKENDWEDQPYDFFGDIEDANWQNYEQTPWDDPEMSDPGIDWGPGPDPYAPIENTWQEADATLGFNPEQFSADIAALSSYDVSVPEELVAGPEGFDPAVFEVPEVNQWINDNINNPDDALAQQVAQDAANAYFELVNSQTPNMLPPEAEVPELEFNPGDIPVSAYTQFSEGTTPEDYSAALTAAAAMTQMPEFAGMSVEEITQAILSDPDAIANITSSGDPTIDRQTGETIEDPNAPPIYDENQQIAFGNAQELVDMNPEQMLQEAEVALPEGFTPGSDGSIDSVLDQVLGPGIESQPPAEVSLPMTEVDPSQIPGAEAIPNTYPTPDGPLQSMELGDGSTVVMDPTGQIHLMSPEGTEVNVDPRTASIYASLFNGGDVMEQRVLNGQADPTAPGAAARGGVTLSNGQDIVSSAQGRDTIAQINGDLKSIDEQINQAMENGNYSAIAGLEARKDALEDTLREVRTATNTLNTRENPAVSTGRANAEGSVLTITTEQGVKVLLDPAGNTVAEIPSLRSGALMTTDGQRIPNVHVDLASGTMFTRVNVANEDGTMSMGYLPVEPKRGDTLLWVNGRTGATMEYDPYRSTQQMSDDRARAIAQEKEDQLRERQRLSAEATAARQAAARSAAGGARSSGGSRSSGGGANKNASEANEIRREELAQRIKEADESAAIRREELNQRASEAASQLGATYAKLSQDDTQFNSNLQVTRDTLQQKIADSQQQQKQFEDRHQLDLAEQAARRTEAAQQLDAELQKIQNNQSQFLQSHALSQESLLSQKETNAEKLRLEREALELQKQKQQQEDDKPDIVTIGGGRYLQFNKATGEWDVKGDSGFSGSRSRGGSI